MSTVFRASSGIPFFFRSGTCAVPGQFSVGCIPAILSGVSPFAQSKGSFDPNKPLFNANAFEPESSFSVPNKPYYGVGPRISNVRGFGYHNQSLAFIKDTKITERVNFELRAEFFNLWNWHIFSVQGNQFAASAFTTDIASSDFGKWNGSVTDPRNIQVGARITF